MSMPMPTAFAWPPLKSDAVAATAAAAVAPAELQADMVLEMYGRACGVIEPVMKQQMRAMSSGQVLEVRVDDPAARLGVPAWSRLAGHALLTTIEEDERRTRFFLRKR
jgi:TusA-related sulfurtransferase